MQENDVSKICVGSLIIWCKPFFEVNVLIFKYSCRIKIVAVSKFNSRLFIDELNSS